MPGIIEPTIAALQHTLNTRAPLVTISTMVAPLKTYFQPRDKPSPRRTTDKRWHSGHHLRKALRRPHTEDTIRLFVPTSTPDSALTTIKAYLFPRNSQQAEIRGPGFRLQTVIDLTHLVTRCQSICDSVIRDLPYVTQIINCHRGITHAQALATLRVGGIQQTDIELLGIARNNKAETTLRGDTVVVVWKRVWYPGEAALVLCPPITHQLLAGFRTKRFQKPRQYSHYLPLDDITARQRDCDTVSNYPRQSELGHEGNMSHHIIYEYKAAGRGRRSPISTHPPRPIAFAGYWLTKLSETRRTNMSGRPQRQTLQLPDDSRMTDPDSGMRVECRRHKAACEDMRHTEDISTVRVSLDSTTATQSYHEAQILQLSQDLAQLRELLKILTEKQSLGTGTTAHSGGAVPLNPTANTYCPQSPTSPLRATAPAPIQTSPTSFTGAANVNPAPGTPAATTTPPSPPAPHRAHNTKGGFAAAFKTALSRNATRSTTTTARLYTGSPNRAGTTISPPSAPTTELTPSPIRNSARDVLKATIDPMTEIGDPDYSEGDY